MLPASSMRCSSVPPSGPACSSRWPGAIATVRCGRVALCHLAAAGIRRGGVDRHLPFLNPRTGQEAASARWRAGWGAGGWDQMPVEELWRPPRRRGHPGWSCCFARGRGRREPGGLRWWSPAGRAAWHAQWPVDHGRPCRAGARLERFTTTVSLVAPRWPGGDRLGADPAPHGWRPPTCPPGAGGSWAVAPRPGEDHKRLATGVLRLGSMRMAAFLDAAVLTAMVGLLTDAGGRRCGAPRCGPARAAASGVIDPGLQQTHRRPARLGEGGFPTWIGRTAAGESPAWSPACWWSRRRPCCHEPWHLLAMQIPGYSHQAVPALSHASTPFSTLKDEIRVPRQTPSLPTYRAAGRFPAEPRVRYAKPFAPAGPAR